MSVRLAEILVNEFQIFLWITSRLPVENVFHAVSRGHRWFHVTEARQPIRSSQPFYLRKCMLERRLHWRFHVVFLQASIVEPL